MTSEKYMKITNEDGKVKFLPLPPKDQITRINSSLYFIDFFMRGIIHKKHKDGLISDKDYKKNLENFCYIDSIFTRLQICSLLRNDIHCLFLDVIADHNENEGFPIPRANSLRVISLYKEYLDNIYSIMENISRFNLFYFRRIPR